MDTYWDENIIMFPRRSPTIYPGQAYKLTKAEKFALKSRQDEIEQAEYSNSDDHSDSADSDDDTFQIEQKWPKPSRKFGHIKNLAVTQKKH